MKYVSYMADMVNFKVGVNTKVHPSPHPHIYVNNNPSTGWTC